MPHYSPERTEAILQKMGPPHILTVAELAGQEGNSAVTFYQLESVCPCPVQLETVSRNI